MQQTLSLGYSLHQELELSQSLTQSIFGPDGPIQSIFLDLYQHSNCEIFFQTLLSKIQNPNLRDSISSIIYDPTFWDSIKGYEERLALQRGSTVDAHNYVSARYCIKLLGNQDIQQNKYAEQALYQYLCQRDVFTNTQNQLRTYSSNNPEAANQLSAYMMVKNLVGEFGSELFQNINKLCTFVLQQPTTIEYMREKLLIEQSSNELGTKIIQRRITNANVMSKYFNQETFVAATSNAIAQSMLVSLGIIGPELFKLRTMTLVEDRKIEIAKTLDIGHGELQKLQDQYHLQRGPAIFFHRRATQTSECDAKKHQEISRFISERVRGQMNHYMKHFRFDECIKNIIAIKAKKGVSLDEKFEQYAEIFVQQVFTQELCDQLKKDARTIYFAELSKIK